MTGKAGRVAQFLGCSIASHLRRMAQEEHTMMDILMLALALGWFALAIGYTYACERL